MGKLPLFMSGPVEKVPYGASSMSFTQWLCLAIQY